MTREERIRDYLLALEPEGDPLCEDIARDAAARGIPIIRRETGALLGVLAAPGKVWRQMETLRAQSLRLMAQPAAALTLWAGITGR